MRILLISIFFISCATRGVKLSDQIPSMHPSYKDKDLIGFVDKNGDLKDRKNYVYINEVNFTDRKDRSLASAEKYFFDLNFQLTNVTIVKNGIGFLTD